MHDVPYPIDYGGVADLYGQLKNFHKQGYQIILHLFTGKRRNKQYKEIADFCTQVFYYPRQKFNYSLYLPYMVSTRKNRSIEENLKTNDYPILYNGIQVSYLLFKKVFQHRKQLLRLHNVEFIYYKKLGNNEKNIFKKLFYYVESFKLKYYEKRIAPLIPIASVSMDDVKIYKEEMKAVNISFVPILLPWQKKVNSISTRKAQPICLYHGNLAINENENAVIALVENVFKQVKIPFVVAGKNPSKKLQRVIDAYAHISLRANISEAAMQELIDSSAIQILPSFNKTGVKIKLIYGILFGNQIFTNVAGVSGSNLESVCTVYNSYNELKKLITEHINSHTNTQEQQRQVLQVYDNEISIKKLMKLLD